MKLKIRRCLVYYPKIFKVAKLNWGYTQGYRVIVWLGYIDVLLQNDEPTLIELNLIRH